MKLQEKESKVYFQMFLGSFFSNARDSVSRSVKELFWMGYERGGKQGWYNAVVEGEAILTTKERWLFLFLGQTVWLVLRFTCLHVCAHVCAVCAHLLINVSRALCCWVTFLFTGMGPTLQNPLILIHRNSPTTGVESICMSKCSLWHDSLPEAAG